MRPIVEYDFTITWGLPFRLPFTWEQANGDPVNLTGYVRARAEVRPAEGDSHLIVAFATEPADGEGRIELGGAAGTIVMSLPEPQTWDVRREGVYDLFLYHEDETVEPVKFAAGKQRLVRSVTRRVVSA